MKTIAYKIKTKRLVIRALEPKDAFLIKETIDESLQHLSRWLGWAKNEPEDIEKKIQRMRHSRASFDLDKNYIYGIFLSDESKLIGNIALKLTVGEDAREIGYWIHVDYLNQGYATEAAAALVKVVFETNQAERIEIHCDDENSISSAIPRRLAFHKEAIIRRNETNEKGNRKKNQIWILFKEDYQHIDKLNIEMQAFDIIDRKIL